MCLRLGKIRLRETVVQAMVRRVWRWEPLLQKPKPLCCAMSGLPLDGQASPNNGEPMPSLLAVLKAVLRPVERVD